MKTHVEKKSGSSKKKWNPVLTWQLWTTTLVLFLWFIIHFLLDREFCIWLRVQSLYEREGAIENGRVWAVFLYRRTLLSSDCELGAYCSSFRSISGLDCFLNSLGSLCLLMLITSSESLKGEIPFSRAISDDRKMPRALTRYATGFWFYWFLLTTSFVPCGNGIW